MDEIVEYKSSNKEIAYVRISIYKDNSVVGCGQNAIYVGGYTGPKIGSVCNVISEINNYNKSFRYFNEKRNTKIYIVNEK